MMVMGILAVVPTVGAAIIAQSPTAFIRLDPTFTPPSLEEVSSDFSFLMWLRRSRADAQWLHVLDVPGGFTLFIDGVDESIRAQLGGTPAPLEVVLPLRDAGGSVPLDEWILIAVSWDASAGRFEGWARSETASPVHDAVIDTGFVRSAPTGMPSLGRPELPGSLAQEGQYGLIVFRNHALVDVDVDDVWSDRDYLGPYRLTNTGSGGNMTGTAGATWLANHAILTKPSAEVVGSASAALPGLEVAADNYCVLTTDHPQSSFVTVAPVVEAGTGADAFTFASPYAAPPDQGFFVRKIPTLGPPLGPPTVGAIAPGIRAVAQGSLQGLRRCLVSANSRGTRLSPGSLTWPENYAHGFIEARLGLVAGVMNRPARPAANKRWFGFDMAEAPDYSGPVKFFTWDPPLAGFARLWSGSAGASVGPGSGIWMGDGSAFALKCRPEPGSLVVATAPLVVRAYMLRFPGAGTLEWRPVKAAGQSLPGTAGGATSIDLGSPSPYAHTLDAGDVVEPSLSKLVLAGDHQAVIQPGDACYISAGPGVRGFSLVSSVSGDGKTTEVVFEHWFSVDPASGSALQFGSWEIVTVEYEWPALDDGDEEVWRGLELTAAGGPLVNFAWDAWRPNVNGIVFGVAGWAGNGYTPQIQESFAAAFPAWINALGPDLWLEVFAQQRSAPSAMSDYLDRIRETRPSVEVAWLGDGEHWDTTHETWDRYILDHAGTAGVVAATVLEDEAVGTFEDQCADALRSDTAHWSQRGNARLAERWLDLLATAALASADLDGDGVVGVNDFLLLLSMWGACPAPPDPCPADLDGDGIVGVTDFLILLEQWGV